MRPNQGDVVNHLIAGEDVLFTAPTGHGKSLTFQLPALYLHHNSRNTRVSFVVTPLLSLMKNQVNAARSRRLPVEMMSSAETPSHNAKVMADLKKAKLPYALVYLTPEKITSDWFLHFLKSLYDRGALGLFAIDEAHCISEWGHDFRKAYRNLGQLKSTFPDISIVALTATATPPVQKDILQSLNIRHAHHVHVSFLRRNIHYSVFSSANLRSGNKMEWLKNYIHSRRANGFFERGIVYAFKKCDVQFVADMLNKADIPALPYSAGLKPAERSETQHKFESGQCPIIVATAAFGMGIDVPNIRYVVHFNLPKTVESFYQESGRAGRDGKAADSVLCYSKDDIDFFRFINSIPSDGKQQHPAEKEKKRKLEKAKRNQLDSVVRYVKNKSCRRVQLMAYFGETVSEKKVCGDGCDNCCKRTGSTARKRPRPVAPAPTMVPAANFSSGFQTAASLLNGQKAREATEQQRRVSLIGNRGVAARSSRAISHGGRSGRIPIPLAAPSAGASTGFRTAASVLRTRETIDLTGAEPRVTNRQLGSAVRRVPSMIHRWRPRGSITRQAHTTSSTSGIRRGGVRSSEGNRRQKRLKTGVGSVIVLDD